MRHIFFYTLLIILTAGGYGFYVFGPEQLPRQQKAINITSAAEELYLAQQEARFSDIWHGAEKEIIWFNGQQKTKLAIIYLHGFSASKQEVRPLPDLVAQHMQANLFYSRFAGHGREAQALGAVHWQDWQDDVREAVAVGKRIADKQIIIATSAGAAILIANSLELLTEDVAAVVFISPLLGIPQFGLPLLAGPWGGELAELFAGEWVEATTLSEQHARWWTIRYPSRALVPLAVTVQQANQIDVAELNTPALFIYSAEDGVVEPEKTAAMAQRWVGSQSIIVADSSDPKQHVIAGKIRSPETTSRLAQEIVLWLKSLELAN